MIEIIIFIVIIFIFIFARHSPSPEVIANTVSSEHVDAEQAKYVEGLRAKGKLAMCDDEISAVAPSEPTIDKDPVINEPRRKLAFSPIVDVRTYNLDDGNIVNDYRRKL